MIIEDDGVIIDKIYILIAISLQLAAYSAIALEFILDKVFDKDFNNLLICGGLLIWCAYIVLSLL